MTAAYHHTGFFSIKNPTIESEVSWSSLLSFYTLEEQSFQHKYTLSIPVVNFEYPTSLHQSM